MPVRYCGRAQAHSAHRWWLPVAEWRISDLLRLRFGRRQCLGGMVNRCGRPYTHTPHSHGEYGDEMCRGEASGHP